MCIKKLTVEETAEGLVLDMINMLSMDKNYSPIQLHKGDDPVEILKCSTGYWVMYESGKYLKDEKGKLIVYPEKQCRIARARYLLNFGDTEKKQKINQLVTTWKNNVRIEIDKVKSKIQQLKDYVNPENASSDLTRILVNMVYEQNGNQKEYYSIQLAEFEPQYLRLQKMWEENKIVELMELFNLKHFDNPMFSAKTDNPQDMAILKNTFGGPALSEWDGDVLNRYAALEIEKQYYS